MTGILIAPPAGRVVTIVLLLVAADVVLSALVEVALFLVVCHGSNSLGFYAPGHCSCLPLGRRCPWARSALLPGVSLLAATAAGSGASSGTVAALFCHCSRISTAAFLSHFHYPFSAGLPQAQTNAPYRPFRTESVPILSSQVPRAGRSPIWATKTT